MRGVYNFLFSRKSHITKDNIVASFFFNFSRINLYKDVWRQKEWSECCIIFTQLTANENQTKPDMDLFAMRCFFLWTSLHYNINLFSLLFSPVWWKMFLRKSRIWAIPLKKSLAKQEIKSQRNGTKEWCVYSHCHTVFYIRFEIQIFHIMYLLWFIILLHVCHNSMKFYSSLS